MTQDLNLMKLNRKRKVVSVFPEFHQRDQIFGEKVAQFFKSWQM